MSKTDEQVVELDAAAIEAIAKQVQMPEINLDELAEKLAAKAPKVDKEKSKLKEEEDESDPATRVSEDVPGQQSVEKMSKENFLVAQVKAIVNGDSKKLGELNKYAAKSLYEKGLVTKATYMNAGVAADGGVLVPNAELMSDVLSLLPNYSPLAGRARVVTLTEGNSIDIDAITADVVMTEVGTEGGQKTVTKPNLAKTNVALREFAGITILTKKLLKQSALDVYAIVRDSFARAIAKKREELLLTDSTSGIVNKAGRVNTVSPTGNTLVGSITLKQLKAMPFAVPTASAQNGAYVFSRALLGSLAGREDTTGQPIVTINSQNGGTLEGTFNGYPFVVAETLGTTDAASTTHAVFGNWSQYAVVVRQGDIDTQVFDSGVVVDGSSVSHNLIQENKVAVRAEIWENVGYPLPGAFVTLTTSAT